MRTIKYILTLVALLAAILPCFHHDDDVVHHEHDVEDMPLHIEHGGHGHDCCDAETESPQNRFVNAGVEVPQVTSICLFQALETKPVSVKPPPIAGVLAHLQTIQLLI